MVYLRKAKRDGKITHWEIATDNTRTTALFGVRVAVRREGSFMNQHVSHWYYGRNLLRMAKLAVSSAVQGML